MPLKEAQVGFILLLNPAVGVYYKCLFKPKDDFYYCCEGHRSLKN